MRQSFHQARPLICGVAICYMALCGSILAREWKSRDGTKSFEGDFVSYSPPMVTILRTDTKSKATFDESFLSELDQQYCKLASHVMSKPEGRVVYVVKQVLDQGMVCAKMLTPFYTGETIFIWGDFTGVVVDGQMAANDLYATGNYKWVNQNGSNTIIRSFATSLDRAVEVWRTKLPLAPKQ